MTDGLLSLSGSELVRDDLVTPHGDQDASQNAFRVLALGIDAKRAPQLADPLRLVDMSMQPNQRLVFLDRLAHGDGPNRLHLHAW